VSKIPHPQFEGQTKTKLGNTEVKGIVEAIVNDKLGAYLEENPSVAKRVIGKAIDAARARDAAARPATWSAAKARWTAARCPASWATARSATRPSASSISIEGDSAGGSPSRGAIAVPGHPAAQGQDSERREGPFRQDAEQRRDQDHDRSARLRHRRRRTSTSKSSLTTGSSS